MVEGDSDKAYLQMVARCRYKGSLEAHGIVIISVGGNGNIEKPLVVFRSFGIKVYPVWDNDKPNAQACSTNRKLLRLCGSEEEDWPEGIHDTHAIFSPKLEAIIEDDVRQAGIDWTALRDEVCNQIGGELKSHAVVSEIVKRAHEQRCQFPFASQIIERVMTLTGIPVQLTASGSTPADPAASTEEHTQ
ncbi:MAG: ATP-dependent endonuclease [Chloroflexaceae bacterium]|nr:ATP-dependent endonuclease [Chloroflexaceae bacterium]